MDAPGLILWQVTSLLPLDAFLEIISQLVGVAGGEEGVAGSEDVQEKTLAILLSKLKDPKTQFLNTHVRS